MENTKEIDHSKKRSERKIETYRRRTERRWIHGDELGGGVGANAERRDRPD